MPPSEAIRSTFPLDAAKVAFGANHHAVLIGATLNSIHAASEQLRATGRSGVEHVLFSAGLESGRWHGELQTKLEEVFRRSWRAPDISLFVVRDGFTDAKFNEVLAGLQFIPRPVYLVSAIGAKGGAALQTLRRPKSDRLQQILKRGLDIAGGAALLVFLAPLMLVISLLIKFDSSGPVLFRQRRLGFLGQPFEI